MLKRLALLSLASSLLSISAQEAAIDLPAAPVTEDVPKPISAPSDIYTSVVRIEAATQVADYKTPWNSGRFSGGIGTGFLVGENQFLTNAHVVSDARRLLITMHGSPQKHVARVKFIAHDCDLAMLELENFEPFNDLPHLEIGTLPKLESQVRVIGYPVGGDRLSVTRGVVSRIDFRPYSHSIVDSHLVVQIDAAINPGNSGGPVLQDGKVVGVAFQGLRSADNTGYMIPTPVVERFLEDIKDGSYDRYVELGVQTFQLFNPAMRSHYGLKPSDPGVLVTRVLENSSAAGVLEEGDILTTIDNKRIDSAGMVKLDGEAIDMNEIVERKFADDTISVSYVRDGENRDAQITLKPFKPALIYSVRYEQTPRYVVHGGLVFQPLNRNVFAAHKFSDPALRRLFTDYTEEAIYKEREDLVVLSTVLSDELTRFANRFQGKLVDKINGETVTSLSQAQSLLSSTASDSHVVIEFLGIDIPLVLPANEIEEANERVQKNYNIPKLAQLEEQPVG